MCYFYFFQNNRRISLYFYALSTFSQALFCFALCFLCRFAVLLVFIKFLLVVVFFIFFTRANQHASLDGKKKQPDFSRCFSRIDFNIGLSDFSSLLANNTAHSTHRQNSFSTVYLPHIKARTVFFLSHLAPCGS